MAGPLILSTGALTVMLFVDRMFLSWHGQDSIAACIPAAITYFTICSFFLGTAQYTNAIVAQHHGAGDMQACARAVWQGVFFALLSLPVFLLLIPVGLKIFSISGHEPSVLELEKQYFTILMCGGVSLPLNGALSSFFSGRGKTWTVLQGNVLGNAVNIFLDYCLIFGELGFPEMGIRGAGLATAVSGFVPVFFFGLLFLSQKNQARYATRRQFRIDRRLFAMLLKYGMPAGVQFSLDIGAFALFVLLVGRIGPVELSATNIVLSIELVAFLPMAGMSIATATLVGEYIGREDLALAEKSVRSSMILAVGYIGLLTALFLAVPEFFIEVFRSDAHETADFDRIVSSGAIILRMVAIYSLFVTAFIIYSGALKGAGDTTFAMWAQIVIAWIFFVPPVYIMVERWGLGVMEAWAWATVYGIVLGIAFHVRFRSGRWKEIGMVKQT